MIKIKRIYSFILQTFLPIFLMTFCICLFIVLMQFLWRNIDELVGKGLGIGVMAELFFYAALNLCPMALPLAVLLASLMTFGNLGESLELLAMKASGISLLRIMKPLIYFVIALSIGAFYFQNDVLPMANTKMYSLLIGIKNKSPELEIPEGVFYKEINDYNIYVGHKDHKTGMLYDVTIYIFEGNNIEDAIVTVADSARIQMGADKNSLKLTLWSGEQVGTYKERRTNPKHPKYRRESFKCKEVYIPYSNNLERTDESMISSRHVGKNLQQLMVSVDSLDHRIDSINTGYGYQLRDQTYYKSVSTSTQKDSAYFAEATNVKTATPKYDMDSIYASLRPAQMERIMRKAVAKSGNVVMNFDLRKEMQMQEAKNRSYHEIEIHRKFTLSIGVLIFFFIGASIGAIIRKGGLSIPIVVSVIFFIIYYLIDNTGYKMARDGVWEPWFGIWLSSMILTVVGVFLTWRAINDSTLFDWDAYTILVKRIYHRMGPLIHTFRKIRNTIWNKKKSN